GRRQVQRDRTGCSGRCRSARQGPARHVALRHARQRRLSRRSRVAPRGSSSLPRGFYCSLSAGWRDWPIGIRVTWRLGRHGPIARRHQIADHLGSHRFKFYTTWCRFVFGERLLDLAVALLHFLEELAIGEDVETVLLDRGDDRLARIVGID